MRQLTLEMLPAAEGDALLLTYGPSAESSRVLIDGGRRSSYRSLRDRILEIPVDASGHRRFELLVVTHIDADHIEGVICLLQDDELRCRFDDVWFNDWNHLKPLVAGETPSHLGPEQGEFLGALLADRGLPWNEAFGGGAIVMPPEGQPLPKRLLPGGLELTIVSPSIESLIALREEWKEAIEAAGFRPGNRQEALRQFADKAWSRLPHLGDERSRTTLDHAEANGSSIAFLAEYAGKRLLLSGDAWPQVMRPGLTRWRKAQDPAPDRVALNAFKVAHHGSKKNITPQLMGEIACPAYLISTSGARFHHPDADAIRIILAKHHGSSLPALHFNYRSDDNGDWGSDPQCVARYEADAVLTLEETQ